MNMRNGIKTAAAALALALLAGGAQAASNVTARLNIDVSITQNLSVAVNTVGGVTTSTQTVNWNTGTANAQLVSPTTSTVLNDSGGQTERWQLSTNANSINTANNAEVWAVSTDSAAVGANAFALQAVFGSSNTAPGNCPAAGSSDWNQDSANELSAAQQTYTSALFADASLNAAGGTPNPDVAGSGRMRAGSFRALCWRVITPSSTDSVDTQNIQLTVTAIVP
jgi:hypothetical protein